MRNLSIILISFAFLIGCDKKDDNYEDYRDDFIGEFSFTTFSDIRVYSSLTDQNEYFYDTVFYYGTIEKYEMNKLQIIFQNHETTPDLDSATLETRNLGKVFPTIKDSGDLIYPEFNKWLGNRIPFSGLFSPNKDSIFFSYGYDERIRTAKYQIIGIKTKEL